MNIKNLCNGQSERRTKMLNRIQKRFALSRKGAIDFNKGVFASLLFNLVLMLPAIYTVLFLEEYLKPIFGIPVETSNSDLLFYVLLAIIFMIIMYLVAIVQYKNTYIPVYEESAVRRISLAEKLRKLPLSFFGKKNLSDITSTIMNDCTDLEQTFSHAVPQLFASIISIIFIGAGMLIYNCQLALALLWVVPVAIAIILISKKHLLSKFTANHSQNRIITEQIQEGLDNIQEIKSYNQEDSYLKELNNKIDTYENTISKNELMVGVFVNGAQAILKLGVASVIIVGAHLLNTNSISLFSYLIFLVVASRIYAPIEEVLYNLASLFYLDIRIDRMNKITSLPTQEGTVDFTPSHYDIEFKNVNFSYESGNKILSNTSFTVKQGEITALVGPSGSGKSTAAKLAARFWDIQSGNITLGGKDIGLVDAEALLKNYSVVFQDVVLFNTSIKDNIRIGKRNATDEEIIEAAKLAQCDEFINKMPQGYDTIIGENGETLSGGERQRISIARALLKDAPIVLLDEATASLDVENETKIQAGISALVHNKTVLIIAHRMRTIANADKIIVLNHGTVAEMGTPAELKQKKGLFAKMVEKQTEN